MRLTLTQLLTRKSMMTLLFLLPASHLWAAPEDAIYLPPMDTDAQKLSYLLAVKTQVPKLFKEAALYDINLFELMREESQLLAALKTNPTYLELFRVKKYHQITVTPPKGGLLVQNAQIKPEAVQAWRKELTETLKSVNPITHGKNPNLEEYIQAIADRGGIKDIGSLSKTLNQKIYDQIKSSQELKSAYNALPKDLLQKLEAFKPILDRGPPSDLQAQLAQSITELKQAKENQKLAHLLVVLSYKKLSQDATQEERLNAIQSLTDQDLILLSDQADVLQPIVGELFKTTHPASKEQEKVSAAESVFKRINFYAQQTSSKPELATEPVTITQVIPPVGVFRGCTGGDCSSQYSFPYPNDPHERVYLIQGDHGGYVSSTEVALGDGKKGLYVITVSGSRVSAGTTELILRGLEASKKELGVDHILLPTPERLPDLINFPAPKRVYERYTRGKVTQRINYLNSDLRRQIEVYRGQYNLATYDHAENNTHAIILAPSSKKSQAIKSEVHSIDIHPMDVRSIESTPTVELLDFLLDLNQSNRTVLLKRTLQIPELNAKIKESEFKKLVKNLGDCKGSDDQPATINHWLKNLENQLSPWLGTEHTNYLKSNKNFLYPGLLNCTDAFDPKNIDQTAEKVISHFKSTHFSFQFYSNWRQIYHHKPELEQTHAFKKLIERKLEELKNPDSHVRESAASALGHIIPSDEATHFVIAQALNDPDSSVRASAASALENIMPTHEQIHIALARSLNDTNPHVRTDASSALMRIKSKSPAVHELLIQSLKSPTLGNPERNQLIRFLYNTARTQETRDHLTSTLQIKTPASAPGLCGRIDRQMNSEADLDEFRKLILEISDKLK